MGTDSNFFKEVMYTIAKDLKKIKAWAFWKRGGGEKCFSV